MPNPTWPATLPDPQADTTAAYGAPNNVLESTNDAGPPKRRRRYTGVEIPFAATVRLTQAQYATLEDFYYNTLQQVMPFDWTDFRTGAAATYVFTKDGYSSTYIQGSVDCWLVKLSLARQP